MSLTLALAFACIPALGQLGIGGAQTFSWIVESSRYGAAVAIGDINGDGRADIAVGMPSADFAGMSNPGMVHLSLSNGDSFTIELISSCEDNNDVDTGFQIGSALAIGHFDSDSFADLAIGMPGASAGAAGSAGAVCVVYGNASLPFERVRFDQTNLQGAVENGDEFGAALAAGDLNGDGFDELVVGVPGEDVLDDGAVFDDAGAINVILGTATGLTAVGNFIYHQGDLSLNDTDVAADERFGASLVIGNFWNNALYPDNELAVGAPGDMGSGSVFVFGSQTGLLAQADVVHDGLQGWDLIGTPVSGDTFGAALAAGDFNGDGLEDLAVGTPGDDDLGLATQAGAVTVIYAGPSFLSDEGETVLYEWTIDGGSGAGVDNFDRFGDALASGDFDGDGIADLAVGASLDNSLGVANSGEVTVLYGHPLGIQIAGHQIFDMIFFDTLEPGDEFGAALATAPLRSAGADSLLVGIPGRAHELAGGGVWPETGRAVLIASRSLFTDGFESADVSRWE